MSRPSPRTWTVPLISLGICVLVAAAFVTFRYGGNLQYFELKLYDAWLRWQPKDARPSPVVLIGIDDRDIWGMKHSQVSDHELALMINRLEELGPSAIGIDLVRDMPVPDPTWDNEGHKGSDELATALTKHTNVITIMKLAGDGIAIPPPAPLSLDSEQAGCGDVVEDIDGTVRRGILSMDDSSVKSPIHSFSLRLAQLALRKDGISLRSDDDRTKETLYLGKATLVPFEPNFGGYVDADAGGFTFLLDYKKKDPFKEFSWTQVSTGQVIANDIKDKVVIIGKRSEVDKDYFDTPIKRDAFGMDIHGVAVDQLLRGAKFGSPPIRAWPRWGESLWILLWSILGGAVGFAVRSPIRFFLFVFGGLLLLPPLAFAAFTGEWWIPVVPPAMTWFTSAAFVTSYVGYRERENVSALKTLFSIHVGPEVMGTLWRERDRFLAGGKLIPHRVIATVLFTDMKSFARVSEGVPADALMSWLNEYMETMSKVVADNGGVVNKYIGDSIMAIFGVPIAHTTTKEQSEDACKAVKCAIEMRKKLAVQNVLWKNDQFPTTGMRIGIYTGELIAGSLGSARRLEYTVIGNTVNTASRLEGHGKNTLLDPEICGNDCRILIGDATYRLLNGDFETRSLGKVTLSGMDHPIEIYGVVGYAAAAPQGNPIAAS